MPSKETKYQKSWSPPFLTDKIKKIQNDSKKAKNDFLRGLNMGKLRQLTYSIDRNQISKILVTPIFDGYQKKFKMALKRPKMIV